MDTNTFIILIIIGLCAGTLSGFVGVGGGVIIVPALVYFMGLSQLEAQGTSLLLMLPPIGILAVYKYYKTGNMNLNYGIIIACAFVVGGLIGAKLSHKISPAMVKLIFGGLLVYVAGKMLWSGYREMIQTD